MAASARAEAGEAKRAAAKVPDEAEKVKSTKGFQWLARAGIGARAAIYFLLAYIAADIAIAGRAPAPANGQGALAELGRQPGGRALLVALAVGLAGYALWREAQALGRSSGGDKKAAASALERTGWATAGAVYGALCVRAVLLAASSDSGGGGGGASAHPQPWVAVALRWPAGPLWVGAAGVVAGGSGVALAVWGVAHDYGRVIDERRSGHRKLQVARALGIVGEVVRGLLIVLVSAYLVSAAVRDNPSQAKSLGQALSSFHRTGAGPELLAVAALGLASFGAYSCFEALYRDI